ncbi:MAG: InlB B-repeat-containing protein [Clostridia bacterium]|nr:InlB B-repeat-containing protein [Clostridia bacterium]
MKNLKRVLFIFICAFLAVACMVTTVPEVKAAGVMRMVIDGITYNKEYTDLGALALTHWHYDASEDKLTLENFGTSYEPKSELFVYPYSGNLTVELKGNSYIYASSKSAMIIIGNVKFTGNGSLTLICDNTYALNTDYTVSITESASLNIDGLAGIMAIKGISIDTTGNVNIHTSTRCMYTFGDLSITSGRVRLNGSDGLYSSEGNVYISGGDTDVEVRAQSKAFALYGEDAYVEWSANGSVGGGKSSPGSPITEYTDQKYFRATFTGAPVLNPPREIYWDDTVIDDAGTTNPVARWSPVANATGYAVNLYFFNDVGYELKKTFNVTDALSCNFGGHFTSYGKYYFTVQPLGDGEKFLSGAESGKSSEFYMFTGEVVSRFYITLPESDYFKIIPENGRNFVYYGEDYSFNIEVDPAYTQSEILVWANKARVVLRGGKYTVDNVTENIIITVGDMSVNTYTVNLPESEAYTIYPLPEYSTEVEYGENFAFSIELADIYMQSDLVVTSNGEELKAKYGIIYTISNITEDQTVEITGLIRDNYEVTFLNIDGSVISTQTIDHGFNASVPADPPAPDGMTFVGWTDKNGNPFDFSSAIVENTSVYAHYETVRDTDGYYLISNLEQLIWFRDEVLFGNTAINGRLTADIEMNDGKYAIEGGEASFYDDAEIWVPIGGYDYNNSDDYVKFYEGDFDGDGHTLSGFYIKYDAMAANASELGIFGVITDTASITDLNVTRSYFEGYKKIGGIAGKADGVVSGCSSSAVLVGVENVGGIAGESSANITSCSFDGRVNVKQYRSSASSDAIGGFNAGGIVGLVSGRITLANVKNSARVTAFDCAGGIVGCSSAESVNVIRSSNSGDVNSSGFSGGILGSGNISGTQVSNSGNVSGETAGGILGSGSLNMTYFYNYADVNGTSAAGGIVAASPSLIAKQAHSFGRVTGALADVICTSADVYNLTSVYYCEQFGNSSYGTPAHYGWFYSGYLSGVMNRENGSDFWGHNGYCPVFGNSEYPVFKFELKDGETDGTYLIENERDLHMVSAFVNNEGEYNCYNYVLTSDIAMHMPDMADNYMPMGTQIRPFSGCFTGGYNKIDGLNIEGDNYVGFFGYTSGALVERLILDNVTVNGNNYVGGIVGCSYQSSVYECNVLSGKISGNESVGGIAGFINTDVYYCDNSADVYGATAVGGIIGNNDGGTIDVCYNSGSVGERASSEVGGVVGRNFGSLTNVANIGDVSGETYVGGIVGSSYGDIYSSYNAGKITGNTKFGAISGEYDDSYSAELCYYLENTAVSSDCVLGQAQNSYEIVNGATAYRLNANGTELTWAQGELHPVFSADDSSDAVIYAVNFTVNGEHYWMAATKRGGKAIAPPDPVVPGYAFIKWDAKFDYVVADVNVRAVLDEPGLISFLPTAFLKINDHEDGAFIYGVYPNLNMTVSQLRSQISNVRIGIYDQDIIYELEPNDRLYTGVTVILYDEMGAWLHIANVVIYGDINSDGYVDHSDAFLLNMLAGGMLEEYDFTFAQYLAADVNHDGAVDQSDSIFLQEYIMKNTFITQSPQ